LHASSMIRYTFAYKCLALIAKLKMGHASSTTRYTFAFKCLTLIAKLKSQAQMS
jgi:hypothetical protein